MNIWGEAEATAFLSSQGFGPGPFGVKRLAGGLWNTVLLAEIAGRRFALKHYAEVLAGTLFPNLPEAEAAALQRLAGLNVAPGFEGFWPEAGVLLYSFVEGSLWRDDVVAVAHLLRRKEAADPAGFRKLAVTPVEILQEADILFARSAKSETVGQWMACRPAAVNVPPLQRRSLVHTDIGAGNLVGAGDDLRLIDWQCPGSGDLAEDVFTFLSPAFHVLNNRPPLTAAQIALFFRALDIPNAYDRYSALQPYFAYRMAGYCCLRLQTAPQAEIRSRYMNAVLAELLHFGKGP